MQIINLGHVQRDADGQYLAQSVLDAIRYQMPEAYQTACRVAGGLSQWLDEEALKTLLAAHDSELQATTKQLQSEYSKRMQMAKEIMYAYDSAKPNMKWAVGRTAQDHEYMELSKARFNEWIARQLERTDLSVSTREDLAAARLWLNLGNAQTIIIENKE